MAGLKEHDLEQLLAVIITHQHADHVLDLMAMAYHLVFPEQKRRIPLYAPNAVFDVMQKYDEVFGISTLDMLKTPIGTAFEQIPVVPGESFSVRDHAFDTHRMKHPVDTMAIRSLDLQLLYTSDGAYTDELCNFAQGCHTLIAEATYPEAEHRDLEAHGHMTAKQCALLAHRSKVQHLVVTHLSDPSDDSRTVDIIKHYFDGIITLADTGLEIVCKNLITSELL